MDPLAQTYNHLPEEKRARLAAIGGEKRDPKLSVPIPQKNAIWDPRVIMPMNSSDSKANMVTSQFRHPAEWLSFWEILGREKPEFGGTGMNGHTKSSIIRDACMSRINYFCSTGLNEIAPELYLLHETRAYQEQATQLEEVMDTAWGAMEKAVKLGDKAEFGRLMHHYKTLIVSMTHPWSTWLREIIRHFEGVAVEDKPWPGWDKNDRGKMRNRPPMGVEMPPSVKSV